MAEYQGSHASKEDIPSGGRLSSSASAPRRLSRRTSSKSHGLRNNTEDVVDSDAGFLNHLTAGQQDKLDLFKTRLLEDGWWQPEAVNGKPTHDDPKLLQFLRARKFDVEGAVKQFANTEMWRKDMRVEELYQHFDVDTFEKTRLMFPHWIGRRDKQGVPIYVFNVKGLNSKNISTYTKMAQEYKRSLPNHDQISLAPEMVPMIAIAEHDTCFVHPLASTLPRPKPEIPIGTTASLVDLTGISLSQFWALKGLIQLANGFGEAYYPETIERVFLIGAPMFLPVIWSWIKRFMDPVTVSKIFIPSKAEVLPTLMQFMDRDCIPKAYGGDLDWDCGDEPLLDEAARKALEIDGRGRWVRGPCMFLGRKRVIVGSENGKLRTPEEEVVRQKPVLSAADNTSEPVNLGQTSSGLL